MSCGCAGRMEKYVLPRAGYERDPLKHGWTHEATGDFIANKDIEDHHTRLTAQIVGRQITNFFTKLEKNRGS